MGYLIKNKFEMFEETYWINKYLTCCNSSIIMHYFKNYMWTLLTYYIQNILFIYFLYGFCNVRFTYSMKKNHSNVNVIGVIDLLCNVVKIVLTNMNI